VKIGTLVHALVRAIPGGKNTTRGRKIQVSSDRQERLLCGSLAGECDGDAALLAGLEGAGALAATRPPARRTAVRADRTGHGRRGWGARVHVGLVRELPPQRGGGRPQALLRACDIVCLWPPTLGGADQLKITVNSTGEQLEQSVHVSTRLYRKFEYRSTSVLLLVTTEPDSCERWHRMSQSTLGTQVRC